MSPQPRLVETRVPRDPAGAVLVLHGGASRRGNPMVSPTQLSVLRMIPIARSLARAGRGRLAVFRLLNSTRGWDSSHTPVDDAHWALDRIAERLGTTVPAALVGHSLGGRAAILAATRPEVRSVVALNPWVYPSDGPSLPGREVLIAHGTEDRIASIGSARVVAGRLARTADVRFEAVEGGKHAMLSHHREFEALTTEHVRATLLSRSR